MKNGLFKRKHLFGRVLAGMLALAMIFTGVDFTVYAADIDGLSVSSGDILADVSGNEIYIPEDDVVDDDVGGYPGLMYQPWVPGSVDWRSEHPLVGTDFESEIGDIYGGESLALLLAMYDDGIITDDDAFYEGTVLEGFDYETVLFLYESGYDLDQLIADCASMVVYNNIIEYLSDAWTSAVFSLENSISPCNSIMPLAADDLSGSGGSVVSTITYNAVMSGSYATYTIPTMNSSRLTMATPWQLGGNMAFCDDHTKSMSASTKMVYDGEATANYGKALAFYQANKNGTFISTEVGPVYGYGGLYPLSGAPTGMQVYYVTQTYIWSLRGTISVSDIPYIYAELALSDEWNITSISVMEAISKLYRQASGGAFMPGEVGNVNQVESAIDTALTSLSSDLRNALVNAGYAVDSGSGLNGVSLTNSGWSKIFSFRDHLFIGKYMIEQLQSMTPITAYRYVPAEPCRSNYQPMITTVKITDTFTADDPCSPDNPGPNEPSSDVITVNIQKMFDDPDNADDNHDYYTKEGIRFVISGTYSSDGNEIQDPVTGAWTGTFTPVTNNYSEEGWTDADGRLSFTVPIGNGNAYAYTLTECTDGHQAPFSVYWADGRGCEITGNSVSISSEPTEDIVFTNTIRRGRIELYKYPLNNAITGNGNLHSGYDLSGAHYMVENVSGSHNATYELVTDANGYASVDNIPLGVYTITEIIPSKGYVITQADSVTVVRQNFTAVSNAPETPKYDPVRIEMYKIDGDFGDSRPQGSASLNGAEFEFKLYDAPNLTVEQCASGAYESYKIMSFTAVTRSLENGKSGIWLQKDYGCIKEETFYSDLGHSLEDWYKNFGGDNEQFLMPVNTTLYVRETKAPEGYSIASDMVDLNTGSSIGSNAFVYHILDDGQYTIEAYHDVHNTNMQENVWRGGFEFFKSDKNRLNSVLVDPEGKDVPQGDAEFKDATFSVINNSTNSVVVNGVEYLRGQVCYTFKVDEHGYHKTAADLLPYGDYLIVEVAAPLGYHLPDPDIRGWEAYEWAGDSHPVWYCPVAIRQDGVIVKANGYDDAYSLGETPVRGGFSFQKVDADLNEVYSQGDSTLNDATYHVINRSQHQVYTDIYGRIDYADSPQMQWYQPGEVCYIFTTDILGYYQSPVDALPYGTYDVIEVDPSTGYQLNEGWKKTFTIREEGVLVDASAGKWTYDATAANANREGMDNPVAGLVNDHNTTGFVTSFNSGERDYIGSPEYVIRGGFSMKKSDTNRIETNPADDNYIPQGDGEFKALFLVYNRSFHDVVVNGQRFAPGQVCYTFWTDARGEFTSYDQLLPYGSYEIIEWEPPTGYLLNDIWRATFEIREQGKIVQANDYVNQVLKENVKRGGFAIQKVDREFLEDGARLNMWIETMKNGFGALNTGLQITYKNGSTEFVYDETTGVNDARPQGDGSLAGARYEVVNLSDEAVYTKLDGKWGWHAPGTVCYAIETNYDGIAISDIDALPYGRYEIHETVPSPGYLLDEEFSITFTIDAHHRMYDLTGTVRNSSISELYSCTQDTYKDSTAHLHKTYDKYTDKNYDNTVVSYDASMWSKEQIIRGDFRFYKSDENRIATNPEGDENLPQGDAKYKYGTFDVYNVSDHPVIVEGIEYPVGAVCYSFQVDENGVFDSTKILTSNDSGYDQAGNHVDGGVPRTGGLLPYGTYAIRETVAPQGYLRDDDYVCYFSIRENGQVVDANNYTTKDPLGEVPIRGGFELLKIDLEFLEAAPQGDGTLAGAKFALINRSEQQVYTQGAWHDPGTICYFIETDENGIARSGQYDLPYGTYEVIEYTPSEGYLNATDYTVAADGQVTVNSGFTRTFKIRENGKIYDLKDTPCMEQVIRGDVQIQKWDRELMLSEAIGGNGADVVSEGEVSLNAGHDGGEFGAHLNGIIFQIRNISKHHVQVPDDGNDIGVGENAIQIVTHWNPVVGAYTAETTGNALPYGTYEIQEIATNGTYLLTDGTPYVFQIREDGKLVTKGTDGNLLAAKDYVVRGDIEFRKIAEMTSDRMDTMWVITNLTTNEQHVIVTDNNGEYYSSSLWNLHSHNTNANDVFLERIAAGEEISMSEVVRDAGLWFGLGEDGTMAPASDYYDEDYVYDMSYYNKQFGPGIVGSAGTVLNPTGPFGYGMPVGALPYGKYHIQEVRTDSNKGFGLQDFTFYINRHGYTVDLGTITDYKVTVATKAEAGNGEDVGSTELDFVTLTDTVMYEGLTRDRDYTAVATLMDRDTGAPITYYDENGELVIAQATKDITPTQAKGEFRVDFIVPVDAVKGKTVVVFEELYTEAGYLMAEHKDLTDDNQTIYFPEIKTTAICEETGSHDAPAVGKITIVDTVSYTGLKPGKEYTVYGILMDTETNDNLLGSNGLEVVARKKFVAAASEGSVEITFEVSADRLKGHTVVAFEELSYKGDVIAVHADITDENQSVHFPDIKTNAVAEDTEDHEGTEETVTILDRVTYRNLVPGKEYTMDGKLMNKATGDVVIDAEGNQVTASLTFVPMESDGSVTLTFEFQPKALMGMEVVVFEDLTSGNIVYATHSDITDEGQTVRFPEIRTKAEYCDTGLNEGEALPDMTIQDTVTYKGLTPGKEYVMNGNLVDAETGAPFVDSTGSQVTSSVTFTPDAPDGSIVIRFTFKGENAVGRSIVVFEELVRDGKTVATHADITDENQTIRFPQIASELTWVENGDHEAEVSKNTVLVDEVPYINLTPGATYVVTSELVRRATGEVIQSIVDEFVPEESAGTYFVEFEFDSTTFGGEYVVATETFARKADAACCDENVIVARHTSLYDRMQTVFFLRHPEITSTNAGYCGTALHEGLALEEMTITDVVNYKDLTPGTTYVLEGVLMDADTEASYMDADGNRIVVTKEFVPETPDGSVTMNFTFKGENAEGRTIVVFETLMCDGDVIGEHKDFADENQMVRFPAMASELTDKDGEHDLVPGGIVKVQDVVYYGNLTPGAKYVLYSQLVNKTTGKEAATLRTEFTPDESYGSITVEMEFDSTGMNGQYVVAYETIARKADAACCDEDVTVAIHKDPDDRLQMVYFPRNPEIDTEAKHGDTCIGEGPAGAEITIIDTVTYKDFEPGMEHVIRGIVMDKDTEMPFIDADNRQVTAEIRFTPETSDGVVELTFTFNGSEAAGKHLVVFETAYSFGGELEIAKHEDIDDDDQTVVITYIDTVLTGKTSGLHEEQATSKTVLTDVVSYKLTEGAKYVLTSILVDAENGAEIARLTKDFTAKADGTETVEFTIDASALAGHTVVAYEIITRKADDKCCSEDIVVAEHKDLTDKDQTVRFPEIDTVAFVTGTELDDNDSRVVYASAGVSLTDRVSYSNLDINSGYVLETALVLKSTGKVLKDADGNELRLNTVFVPTDVFGTVDTVFANVDTSALGGDSIVFTQKLYAIVGQDSKGNIERKLLADASDLNDEDETLSVINPKIYTMAFGASTGTHTLEKGTSIVVTDRVTFENLMVGQTYELTSSLVDKATGKAISMTNNATAVVVTFVPKTSNGYVDVNFTINTEELAGKSLVAFESLSQNSKVVAEHKDLDDASQTVSIVAIDTVATAADGRAKMIDLGKDVVVKDYVSYSGLVPGETYVVTGQVVKGDGSAVVATQSVTFKAERASGTVEMIFKVDTSAMQDQTLVLFETVYSQNGKVLAEHKDLKDSDQSVVVRTRTVVQTGVQTWASTMMYVALAALAVAVIIAGGVLIHRKRKADKIRRDNQ